MHAHNAMFRAAFEIKVNCLGKLIIFFPSPLSLKTPCPIFLSLFKNSCIVNTSFPVSLVCSVHPSVGSSTFQMRFSHVVYHQHIQLFTYQIRLMSRAGNLLQMMVVCRCQSRHRYHISRCNITGCCLLFPRAKSTQIYLCVCLLCCALSKLHVLNLMDHMYGTDAIAMLVGLKHLVINPVHGW